MSRINTQQRIVGADGRLTGEGWAMLRGLERTTATTGLSAYVHVQAMPSAVWTINHGLGFRPNTYVFDTAGTEVQGAVDHPTVNQTVITFSSGGVPTAFAGTARLI